MLLLVLAAAGVDGLLDERLELMRVRDLEVLWLASGGAGQDN